MGHGNLTDITVVDTDKAIQHSRAYVSPRVAKNQNYFFFQKNKKNN